LNKTTGLRIWLIRLANAIVLLLSGCGVAMPTSTPTPDWRTSPTHIYYIPPSDVSEYTHYTPSEIFKFHLEFDYPSFWWLQEYSDEIGIPSVFLGDPGFLSLPTPVDTHPVPNDFGRISIWIMPSKPGQTPEAELKSHQQNYSNIHWMTVLNDYKTTLDGREAYILEYQTDDRETSPSLMFNRRVFFMVKNQVFEIIYTVAEKDRGGEFDKGYEYFFNSLEIVP
jgi:hypothetical protein